MDEAKRNDDGSLTCLDWFFVPGMEDCYHEYTFSGDDCIALEKALKTVYKDLDAVEALTIIDEKHLQALCFEFKIPCIPMEGCY